MLLNEIVEIGAGTRLTLARLLKSRTKKVQPIQRSAAVDTDVDVKKKPVSKNKIDTYA